MHEKHCLARPLILQAKSTTREAGKAGLHEWKSKGLRPLRRLHRGFFDSLSACLRAGAFFDLELSSQVQQRIEENLKRGLPAEAFARSTVEFGNEGCYLSLAEVLHINRLGTVFTD